MARVLVVEDEESIARLIEVGLELAGHKVTVARNGTEAVKLFPKAKPEIVLLDWMLPDRSGMEVLGDLKSKGWRKDVRVIMVTAKAHERDIMRGWQAGVDGYLTKPFDMDVLTTAVKDVLDASPAELARRREEELRKARLLRALDDLMDEG